MASAGEHHGMTPIRFLALALAAVVLAGATACSTSQPRRDPTGERFPSVVAKTLDGRELRLPEAGAGAPLLLLIGYEQRAQFDLDRWLLGIDSLGLELRLLEVPTIPGMIPRLLKGAIDGGMRRGIPEEDWGLVATVYGDADAIAKFTGNADGLTGRVVLLDADGRVVFFHDRGYSVARLRALQAAIDAL